MLLLLLLADARRPTPAIPQIQMCVISFVAKMKKILALSFFSLSLSRSPALFNVVAGG